MRKFLLFISFVVLSLSVVAQVPTIASFSPVSGAVGSTVTITGTNFDVTASNNVVYFGSVKATITGATTTSLTVTVPAGSTYEPLAVINTVTGKLVQSKTPFKVTNSAISSFSVGTGSFVAPINVTASAGASNWYEIGDMISVADYDGDGKSDIAKGSNSTSVNVLRNVVASSGAIATNSFSNAGNFTTGSASFEIASGDIDGDGKLDIVSIGTSNFSILRNTSTSGNISFATKVDVTASFQYRVKLADINLDGRLDVITSSNYSSNFNVYLNTSSIGSISFNTTPTTIGGLSGSRHITIGDINMDGKIDIIAANEGTSNALLFLNTSTSGSVSFGSGIAVAGGYWYNSVGDFDGDGKNDILSNGANVSLLTNNYTSGSFTSSNLTTASNISSSDGLSYNTQSDFNGDGKLDYFTSYQNSGQSISWYRNNYTSGSFTSSSFSGFSNSFSNPYQMIICDLDGDGKQDIVSSASSNVFVQIARNKIGEDPIISVTGSLSPFTKCGIAASAAQQFNISGSYLTANISIAALTGYEYSTDGTTYASTLTLTQSSGTVSSTVYVRLTAASTGSPAGNIILSSTGATSVNVAANGTANSVRPFNQALNFDGGSDKVSIPVSALNNLTNTFTIEAWVKVDPSVSVGTSNMGIATKVVWAGAGLGYGLDIDGGKPRIFSGQSYNNWGGASAPNNISTNTWVHLAGTYDGSNFKIYVDGQLAATQASATGVSNGSQSLTIGSWPNENKFFKGDIDEVRVWNVTRTAAQILQNKDIELNGNESGLVSYYNFNQGTPSGANTTITTLVDATASNLNGTLNTFSLTGATSNWIAGGPMILNEPSLCLNATTTLAHTNSGGTWSSSDANIISIDPATSIATASAAGTATITYTFTSGSCTFTSTKLFTVNALPAAPAATTTINYCQNVTASTLTATALNGNTLQWYTVANAGTATTTAYTPSTTAVGSTLYYVSQKNNAAGCEGPRTAITVNVSSLPVVTASSISFCSGTPITLTLSGYNGNIQWQTSSNNSTWTNLTGATSDTYTVTNITATSYYRSTVSGGTCSTTTNVSTISLAKAAGDFGTALNFDGTDDVVTVPNNAALNISGNISVEAWIKPASGGTNIQNVISKSTSTGGGSNTAYIFPRTDDNWVNFNGYMHIAGSWRSAFYPYPTDGLFHHVAMTYDGSNIKLYLDGNLVKTQAQTGAISTNTNALSLGNQAGFSELFKGTLDEARIWNAALTADQIKSRMNSELAGTETNLVLNYNFNQGVPGGSNASVVSESNVAATTLVGTLANFAKTGATSNYVSSTVVNPIGGATLCIGSPLQLTHPNSGGTWSIPATTGLSISNTGALAGTVSTTATSVVVSYDYTINACSFTSTKTINISQLIAGTATGNETLCTGVAPTAITLAGNTGGSAIQWQESLDNNTYTNIANATAATLGVGTMGVISGTKYYRAAVTTALCGTLNSNVITKGYNNSLHFDGTDDYVQAGAPLPIAANDNFTYEAWVRPSVVDANYRGFLGIDVAGMSYGRGPSMWVGPNGSLHTDSYSGTTRYDMLVNNFFTANTWVHVAWVKNGTTYTVYKNGVQVDTRTAPSNVLFPNANFTIGKLDNYFAGTLDEVRIWNTARTAQEISSSMSSSLMGNEIGLKAYYTFNQGAPAGNNATITSVANLTTTPNLNGTLTNFTKTGATSNFIDGFRALLTSQPTTPSAVCLNANSNTISVAATGSNLTYQWYSNTANSTTGATAISGATSNSFSIPTNVAGTQFYYVVVTGSCATGITSNIVSQVVNASTFTTDVSSAPQNIVYGGTATSLTVASAGATAYQWYSSPSNPNLVSGFSGGSGWTSSTGIFQTFSGNTGANPAIDADGYLRFAYTSPSFIYKEFTLDQAATTISFSAQYASLDNNNDRGKIQLYFYNANNVQVGTLVQSADLTGSTTWQPTALSNITIPTGATKVRVVFYQIQEYPNWAGNYGIAFRNPSVTTNVALNGTPITGATSATYTPSTTTPGALYYYAVATGGCSTATSSMSGLITVGKATPTIGSMSAINKTYGDAAFTLTAPTSNATGSFTFVSSNAAVATISGTTVTIVGAGTATITATQATDANYNAGSVTALLTVAKATPVIAFMADINKTYGDAPFTITPPTSNSNGAFSYTSNTPAVATVAGSLVSIIGAGSATITVSQVASANYNAGSITTLLLVAKANPIIVPQPNITRGYGSPAFTLPAPSSNSTGAFTYTISDAAVATISGATITAVGIGTATITATQTATANFNAGSTTRTITVVKGIPTIGTFAAINKTFGDAAFTLTAPASTSTGAFTYASDNTAVATVTGSTITIVGAGTANITATQAADANYNAGSVTAVLTVAKASRTLTAFADINKTTTDAPFTLVAPTSSAGTGAITYASSNAAVATVSGSTVTIVGIGTSIITAMQAADANYLSASITATLTVILGDSDGDGVPDDVEIREGTDPNNPSSVKDSDGDGVPDFVEIGNGTNPNNPSDAIDSNGNGLSDYYEARNTAPTNIAISASTINENNTAGASIANLTATDINIGEAFTYALIAGTGDTDNASFTITGSSLKAVNAFDFETKTSYSLRLKVTDKGGLSYEKVFVITVADINEAPVTLDLTGSTIAENTASGATVGTLSATDPDANSTFTYSLVSGTGSTDNASFTISGATLKTAAVFDFETKSSYSVRVQVTDAGGLTFEKVFTISVTDVNEAPTNITISNASVLENAVSATTVGTLAGVDQDANSTFTYALVTGTGSTDNASFTITGSTLKSNAVFDFETKNSYTIRVRVTDAGGLSFEKAFTITVTDVNEVPTLTAITDRRVYNVSTSQVVNLAGITAGPETAQTTVTTVSTDKPTTFSSISVVGTQIQFTLAAGITTPQDVVVSVKVKDNGGVANGGVDTLVRTFKLGIDPLPIATGPSFITLGATAPLSASGANAINYTWVAVGGTGIVGSGATINVRPAGTTTYAVVVTNSFGYQATIPLLLTVIADYKLVPANIVTPNGDGVNDKWVIPNIDMYPDNEVKVFDKSGRVVFTKRGYNNEWDGTFNGQKLKEDAYLYIIKFNKDGVLPIRGYVTIVR